jgi:hypothetical protein
MIDLWQQGYEDVYAKRNQRKGESWFKKTSYNVEILSFASAPLLPCDQVTGNLLHLVKQAYWLVFLMRMRDYMVKQNGVLAHY